MTELTDEQLREYYRKQCECEPYQHSDTALWEELSEGTTDE